MTQLLQAAPKGHRFRILSKLLAKQTLCHLPCPTFCLAEPPPLTRHKEAVLLWASSSPSTPHYLVLPPESLSISIIVTSAQTISCTPSLVSRVHLPSRSLLAELEFSKQ